jgi:hypothetical protein
VVVDGAVLDSDEAAAALLQPLRALQPEMDTFARIPAAALIGVHMDPPGPTPAVTDHAVLTSLPPDAVDAFVTAAAAPGLFINELRHLGGAIRRRPEHAGAVASLDGEYIAHTIAMTPVPEAIPSATAAVQAGVRALAPWHAEGLSLTFIDDAEVDRGRGFGASLDRLRALKREYDPRGLFAAAQPV